MRPGQYAVGVCGFGRCGSSMTMQMLAAGGLPPVSGSSPGALELTDIRRAWHVRLPGRAVKLLESIARPDLGIPPCRTGWRFVWLDRDPVQQAWSQVKMIQTLAPATGISLTDDPHLAASKLAASYREARPMLLRRLNSYGPVTVMRYEDVLADPHVGAVLLRDRVWRWLDVDAAAAVVHDRDGRCRPDMAVEAAHVR